MDRLSWKMKVVLLLTGTSMALALFHVLLFGETHTLFFYLALDVVFVPVQVLLVTVLIERLLSEKRKTDIIEKTQHGHRSVFRGDGQPAVKNDGGHVR